MDIAQLTPLLPPITDANRGFWEGTLVGELRLQYGDSGAAQFPDYPVDRITLTPGLRWRAASGRATLWSWVRMHQSYLAAFADEMPYLVALVELEEGPMLASSLVDPPERLQPGMALRVEFTPLDEQRALPRFRVVAR